MLSDTLYEAIQEIEDYQLALPSLYDPVKTDIENVKSAMNALRAKLGTVEKDRASVQKVLIDLTHFSAEVFEKHTP